MTVLVLDSPELIARAAALEAAQARTQVQAEAAGVADEGAEPSAPAQPFCARQEEETPERQGQALTLAI
ncbi:MAG: hypothetical protein ACOCVV_12250 [Marinobacter sp.]